MIPLEGVVSEDGKVIPASDLMSFFPAEVLDSAGRNLRPFNVRVVEHEDYIDYELEFIEDDEDKEQENELAKKDQSSRYDPKALL